MRADSSALVMWRRAALVALLALPVAPGHAQTSAATAAATPAATPAIAATREVLEAIADAQFIGQGRLKFWSLDVYDARLWAPAALRPRNYAASPLALELIYLRNFSAADIAERSIKEMRRAAPISEAQAADWTQAMLRVIPDVKKGDRLTGVHRPGSGATFYVNGKRSGDVPDIEFSKLFFGIWLGPATSEPRLRDALLAGVGG